MFRFSFALSALTLSVQAQAGLLGTDVTLDFGDGTTGCRVNGTVVHPGVEFAGVGPALCMAGSSPRLDVDVMNAKVRWEFTALQDFGFGPGPSPWFTLNNLNPTCPAGGTGTVTGIALASTNMAASEWVPSQVAFGPNQVQLIGDPMALGGDANIRTNPGEYIELDLTFSCGGGGGGSPQIAFGGSCPSAITVSASGFTPHGDIAVLMSNGTGTLVVPSGPCGGTTLGLSASGIGMLTKLQANGSGGINYSGSVGPALCSKYYQFVDVTTCMTSNVEQF